MTGAVLRGNIAALAACLILSACAAPTTSNSAPQSSATSARDFKPVAVEGVEPCRRLSTTRGATGSGGLPAFELSCLTEPGSLNVSRLGGKPTLVNLWATWCGPCRQEMPVLQAAYEQVKERVQFVGVDTRDDPLAAADYLPEVGVTYPQLVDTDGRLLEHTRIPGLPVTLLLDEDGVEVARHVGPLTEAQLTELLDQAA